MATAKKFYKVNLSMQYEDIKRLRKLKKLTGQTYSGIVRLALTHEEYLHEVGEGKARFVAAVIGKEAVA